MIVTNPGFDTHCRRCQSGNRKGSERKKKSEARDSLLSVLAAGEVEGESVFDPVGSIRNPYQVQDLATLADHMDGPHQIGFPDWGQIESDNG